MSPSDWTIVTDENSESIHLRCDGRGLRTVSVSRPKSVALVNALMDAEGISVSGELVHVHHRIAGLRTTTCVRIQN